MRHAVFIIALLLSGCNSTPDPVYKTICTKVTGVITTLQYTPADYTNTAIGYAVGHPWIGLMLSKGEVFKAYVWDGKTSHECSSENLADGCGLTKELYWQLRVGQAFTYTTNCHDEVVNK